MTRLLDLCLIAFGIVCLVAFIVVVGTLNFFGVMFGVEPPECYE